jgi:hypothetical protein
LFSGALSRLLRHFVPHHSQQLHIFPRWPRYAKSAAVDRLQAATQHWLSAILFQALRSQVANVSYMDVQCVVDSWE